MNVLDSYLSYRYPVQDAMATDDAPITLLDGESVKVNQNASIAAYLAQNLLLSLLSFGILPFLYAKQSALIVTDERVVLKTGILRTDTSEYRIEDIQQINTGQSLFEKLLGAGNVQFSTAATSGDITFYGLKDHENVTNTIRNLQRDA